MKTDRWRQTERDGSRDTDIHEHCKHPSYLLLLLAALSWRVLPSSRSSDRVRGEMAQPPGLILMKNVFFRVCVLQIYNCKKVHPASVVFVCWSVASVTDCWCAEKPVYNLYVGVFHCWGCCQVK